MKIENNNKESYISTNKRDIEAMAVNIPCREACPAHTDIPGYIQAMMEGDYRTAYKINRWDNVLPGVLGRVCSRPCEKACRHGWEGLGDSVSICFLKRAATDFGLEYIWEETKCNGRTVCIVGAGPAGLSVANELVLKGYVVTIIDKFDQPGGMLRYGIPRFRLPDDVITKDVQSIINLGVTIENNVEIKSEVDVDKLKSKYDAVVVAIGCMVPKTLNISGVESKEVVLGLNFMISVNKNEFCKSINNVVVIGGGFTAVDCARMCYRLGAQKVTLVYRRKVEDMNIETHEYEVMKEEGVEFCFLASPICIENSNGVATGVRFISNSLTKERSIRPIPDSEFVLEADFVIFAIGQMVNNDIAKIESSEEKNNCFYAGDCRNGTTTVIDAIADGKKVANKVDKFLSNTIKTENVVHISKAGKTGRKREYDFIPIQKMNTIALGGKHQKEVEVETGYSRETSTLEAKRCYLCHYNFQIDINRCICCVACTDAKPLDCIKMVKNIKVVSDGDLEFVETKNWGEVESLIIDGKNCIRCGECMKACPVDCISISKNVIKL